jgi:hypothetical protein
MFIFILSVCLVYVFENILGKYHALHGRLRYRQSTLPIPEPPGHTKRILLGTRRCADLCSPTRRALSPGHPASAYTDRASIQTHLADLGFSYSLQPIHVNFSSGSGPTIVSAVDVVTVLPQLVDRGMRRAVAREPD